MSNIFGQIDTQYLNNSVEKKPQFDVFKIKSAELAKSKNNNYQYVIFEAENINSSEIVKFTIGVTNKNGEVIFGKRLVDKIAFCAGLQNVSTTMSNGKTYLSSLHNKEVGLFLNTREREFTNNEGRMSKTIDYEFLETYQAKTFKLSSEIRDNKEATLFDNYCKLVKHIPLKTESITPTIEKEVLPTAFNDEDIPF